MRFSARWSVGAKNLSAGAYPAKSNSALFSSTSFHCALLHKWSAAEREIMLVHNSCGCCSRSDWKKAAEQFAFGDAAVAA
jgi:hypothetical protein